MRRLFPKLSIRMTLLATIAVLNIIIAGQAGLHAWGAWANYRDAEAMREASATVYLFFNAQKFLSLERAAAMAVLYTSPKEQGLLRGELLDHRARADEALSAALKTVSTAGDQQLAVAISQVHSDYSLLQGTRRLMDVHMGHGTTSDLDHASAKTFEVENKLIADIARAITIYSGRALAVNAPLVRRLSFARAVWTVTEFTGRQYALLGRMIVRQKNPTQEEAQELANWQGRVEYGWDMIEGYVATSDWGPGFRSYIDEAKTQYVMTFEQVKDMFATSSQPQSAVYPMTIDLWLGMSSQALDSLYAMMDSFLELNREYVIDFRAAAARSIAMSLMLLAAVLALSFYSWRLITQRVTRPINLMVDALYRATRGEHAELPAIAFGDDEVGKLATVLERFRENAQELQVERDNARAANIAKSEFLANMSHEIRTPMNVVLGIANILSTSQPLSPKQKEFVRTLRISAEALLTIINDLLDISKIETGNFDLEQIPFVLKSIIDETAMLISVKAREKGLAVEVRDEALEGREFIGDPTRIRQILTNLCGNAVKFTQAGKISVSARAQPSAAPGIEDIFISITDTGVGIPAAKLPVIFEKFTQADSSINRKFGGTGLGLSISKAFAEMMHGTITVDSVEGKGSTFTVHLPLRLRRKGVKLAESVSEPAAAAAPPAPPRTGRRVLLVEDYAPNALVAGAFLDEFGYTYDLAENGYQAIEKAAQHQYDAILMDVQMQGMDGYQATQAIRQFEAHSHAPRAKIIGMTAYALPGDREKCLEVGMDDYIPKPFSPEELQRKLAAEDTAANGAGAGHRVLVVDDNQDSANTLAWSVESLGHEVKVANDGRTAVEIAKDFKPDVVLLDIGMPDADGYQVCGHLRELPQMKETRIIAQTGWGEDVVRSRSAGFNDHLIKPVTLDVLKKLLSQ